MKGLTVNQLHTKQRIFFADSDFGVLEAIVLRKRNYNWLRHHTMDVRHGEWISRRRTPVHLNSESLNATLVDLVILTSQGNYKVDNLVINIVDKQDTRIFTSEWKAMRWANRFPNTDTGYVFAEVPMWDQAESVFGQLADGCELEY